MLENTDTSTCCTCGYEWKTGRNGSHSCTDTLLKRFASSTALSDVIDERHRQINKKGYTPQHDNDHDAGELAGAGSAYALNASCQLYPYYNLPLDEKPDSFTWDDSHWKPKSPREDLVRAAALLIAEIERIDRKGK